MTQKNNVSRRRFIKSVAAGAGAVSAPVVLTACGSDDKDKDKVDLKNIAFQFGHGVASGDPLSDRVIIWTRITPDSPVQSTDVPISWVVATDEALTEVVVQGEYKTDVSKDLTVKVDATGLQPNTNYYYGFTGPNAVKSPVGKTKTLPVGDVSNVTMAVCSCANFPFGKFNVYKDMAAAGADVILHLGDYIYEYKSGYYPTNPVDGRKPDPVEEIVTLNQYRARYNQYRRDPHLQEAHKNTPFICVWDDHEVANDAYKDGAENHNVDEGEGEYLKRKSAAMQAYHEWLPIRNGVSQDIIYRNFQFGDLINLNMLDTRLVARDKPLSYSNFLNDGALDAAAFRAALADRNRTLLGSAQQSSLIGSVFNSSATWEVLGQQVLMGRIWVPAELLLSLNDLQQTLEKNPQDASLPTKQLAVTQLLGQLATIKGRMLANDPTLTDAEKARVNTVAPYNLDAWDGYVPAREEVLRRMKLLNKNLVVFAGDTHNAWASDLYTSNDSGDVERDVAVGVEFATSSVTSPGFEQYTGFANAPNPAVAQAGFEQVITTLVDDLKYMNAADRGYMFVEFGKSEATCEWRYVTNVTTDDGAAIKSTVKRKVLAGAGNRKVVAAS